MLYFTSTETISNIMQIPIRKSEQSKKYTDNGEPIYLTASGIERLKATLENLEKKELPQAIKDMHQTAEMGDFSENAAYQEAKHRLRRINGRIMSVKDRLQRAQIIKHNKASGFIQIGSYVTLKMDSGPKTYQILGPAETDPKRGRISYLSPLGSALMGHRVSEKIVFSSGGKQTAYEIIDVY